MVVFALDNFENFSRFEGDFDCVIVEGAYEDPWGVDAFTERLLLDFSICGFYCTYDWVSMVFYLYDAFSELIGCYPFFGEVSFFFSPVWGNIGADFLSSPFYAFSDEDFL